MACCNCTPKTKSYALLGSGSLLFIIGLILAILWKSIYSAILYSQLGLSPHSTSYKIWKEPPIPIYLKVYLFNVTNADQIAKGNWSVKPNLTEHGPYVFFEKHKRVNLTWNKNNTVKYNQVKTWQFMQEMSKGSLDDKITNLNVITATIADLVKYKNVIIKIGVDWALREVNENLLITHSARKLIFEGYDDRILELVANLSIPGLKIPFSKFGWFYGRNGSATYDGTFEISTGKDNLDNLAMMTKWNGKNKTNFFPSPCDYVKGSTGELWPPLGDPPRKTMKLFSSDICSTLTLDLDEKPSEQFGIDGAKYFGSERTLDNGSLYSDQKCFAPKWNSEDFLPRGLRNTSSCRFGAPAYLSFPHFYQADINLLKAVNGLKPDPKKHQFEVTLEPTTGLPLLIEARGQINIRTQKISGLRMFKNAQTRYWPMMWFEQKAYITDDLLSQLHSLLILENILLYTGWGLIGLGVFLGTIGLFVLLNFLHQDSSESSPLVTS